MGAAYTEVGKVFQEDFAFRLCPRCEKNKGLSEFYLREVEGEVKLYHPWCKDCFSEYARWRRSPEFVPSRLQKVQIPGKKQCTGCEEIKFVSEYHKNKNSSDGLSIYCKVCSKENERVFEEKKKEALKFIVVGTSKICKECKVDQDVCEFSKSVKNKDGLSTVCKTCSNAHSRARTASLHFLPDLSVVKSCSCCGILKGADDYYPCSNHKDGLESICKECDKIRGAARRPLLDFKADPNSTKSCRDCACVKGASDFPASRKSTDGLACYCKICTNRHNVESRKKNVDLKLRSVVRARFSQFLKKMGLETEVDKEAAIKFMGCSAEEFAVYLEKLFYNNLETDEEMTWSNHSKKGWHIDHIISLSSVDLKDPRQLKRVCHYSNLQPLWSKENHRKNAKLPKNFDKEAWLREIEND